MNLAASIYQYLTAFWKKYILKTMRTKFLHILVWAILGLALSTATMAQDATSPFIKNHRLIADPIPLNLEQITHFADRVFAGTSVKTVEKLDPKTNIPVI